MSVPKILCIDTSVLDAQNYNYESSALSSFIAAVREEGFTLLLPDPIEREIKNHIAERVQNAVRELRGARSRAPFLSKWDAWPLKEDDNSLSWTLNSVAEKEWRDFLGAFKVVRLGYEGIDLSDVMTWYERGRSPFLGPKRRSEFPDAFAVAIVARYARSNCASVAVVSQDTGIQSACHYYSELLAFKSLPAFTEAWLAGDARLELAKNALETGRPLVKEELASQFCGLGFLVEDAPLDVEDVQVLDIDLQDLNVVAIGEEEVSGVYQAVVPFIAYCRAYDPDTGQPLGEHTFEAEREASGSIKLSLFPDDGGNHAVSFLSIDGSDADIGIWSGYQDPYDYPEPDDWRM